MFERVDIDERALCGFETIEGHSDPLHQPCLAIDVHGHLIRFGTTESRAQAKVQHVANRRSATLPQLGCAG